MNKELYLYHATGKENLISILTNGLLIKPPAHAYESFGEDSLSGKIFLAFDANIAESYAENADIEFEDIVVLKIKLSDLNQDNFGYDWNNRCEYKQDINSCVYYSDISPEFITICNPECEEYQDINSFETTYLYDSIMDTFDFEVETNMEYYEEYCE